MGGSPPYRKVLIIENDPHARNILYVLLAGMGCEGEVAHGFPNALARISKESFDAVMLDLQCSETSPEHAISQIKKLQPSLVGRVLVITGDVTSPDILDTIERQCLPQVRRRDITKNLRTVLKSLF